MKVVARLMTFLCWGPLFFTAVINSSAAMQILAPVEFTPNSVTLMPGQTQSVENCLVHHFQFLLESFHNQFHLNSYYHLYNSINWSVEK